MCRGHLLAAGAVEAILAVNAIYHGIIPPTINTEQPDEQIPANLNIIVGQPLEKKINTSMSNAFGFG